jgi:hypothetical protein
VSIGAYVRDNLAKDHDFALHLDIQTNASLLLLPHLHMPVRLPEQAL